MAVNLSKDAYCDVCRMWRIIRPATYTGNWGDGKPVNLCTLDASNWEFPITRKENSK